MCEVCLCVNVNPCTLVAKYAVSYSHRACVRVWLTHPGVQLRQMCEKLFNWVQIDACAQQILHIFKDVIMQL